MSEVLDGELIEGVLYLLDNNPIINPTFNCPAISITHLAGSLGFNPSLLQPRQICRAIAPLAETLFPTPRIPIFRTHLNEGWIVFEEPSVPANNINTQAPRSSRRTTLTSYSTSSKKGLEVKVLSATDGIPSAPLRKTSSGELLGNMPERVDPPSSAGARLIGKGKKSFLRPFMLGGSRRTKTIEIEREPLSLELKHMAKPSREETYNLVDAPIMDGGYEEIVDDYLQVETESPEIPNEETAFVESKVRSESDWAPLKGVSKRVEELRVEAVPQSLPSPKVVETPTSSRASPTPFDPLTPVTSYTPGTPLLETVLSPVLSPTTPVQLSPIVPVSPLTPPEVNTPTTPITATPPLKESPPITPITPSLSTSTSIKSVTRELGRDAAPVSKADSVRVQGGRAGREDMVSEEKERERRRMRAKEHRREKVSRSPKDPEPTWLETVFEDLPFGPDRNMSRAVESIKRDYKLHLAEIVALLALAYMIQRSGW